MRLSENERLVSLLTRQTKEAHGVVIIRISFEWKKKQKDNTNISLIRSNVASLTSAPSKLKKPFKLN